MPYGITQSYLPPGRGDIPALTPAEAGTRLSDPGGGCKAELTYLACYIPRWYTRPKMVTRPGSNNRARRALTLFMRRVGFHCDVVSDEVLYRCGLVLRTYVAWSSATDGAVWSASL